MRKKTALLLGLLLLVAGLGACGNDPGEIVGTISRVESGRLVTEGQVVVFALDTFKSLGDLEVYEKGDLLRTHNLDESGTYSFSLAPGKYVVEAWIPQVATVHRQVEVRSGRTTTVDLEVAEPEQ